MKYCQVILSSVLLFGLVGADVCFRGVTENCNAHGLDGKLVGCTARTPLSSRSFNHSLWQGLVRTHISHSFQYLFMSTNFGNYLTNREGLSKLFRKLSDRTWEDAIDTIKYMAKRGWRMTYQSFKVNSAQTSEHGFKINEVKSLAHALDLSHSLADEVHMIHREITKSSESHHDADAMNYLEKKFVEKHTETIRDLAGHTNDLYNLIKSNNDSSLAIFMFDEHLKSLY